MTQYSAVITEAEDRVLSAVKQAQDVALATISTVTDRVGSFVPELPAIPFVDRLPTPAEIVETTYALTERLLEAQKAYALGMLEALSPIISKLEIGRAKAPTARAPMAVAPVATHTATARKATSRKTTSRKATSRKATSRKATSRKSTAKAKA
jgi:hypothetical protein